MSKPFSCLFFGLILVAFSCKKSGSDTANNDSANPIYDLVRGAFTVVPFDTADITALVPLGNLNPPAHTFPTDHMYFYCFTLLPSLPIKSPGNVRILRIGRTHYNAGTSSDHYDYNIAMGSDNSYLYWGHVSNLSPRLLNAVNNFSTAKCEPTYSTGGSTFAQCYLSVSLTASPGEIIGIANAKNGLAGMDFGATINGTGTNPLEYFDARSRAMMEAKLGRYDGKAKRTAAPIGGEINQDIVGTAQGNWFKQGLPRNPEDNHIALVKDNIDPSKQVISVGISLTGLPSNVYYFAPQPAGFVNRNFADVKTDANTYCYTLGLANFPFPGNSVIPSTSVIIKLDNSNTLSVEKRNCNCNCAPFLFTANKVTYTR
ncbi:MAG: hypothetical protein M0Q26_02945 [Chitinophagaceae bacterium]|nr:hypothetical protein [Chitinophagaceae bacterium]MDP1812090.1 hypothetical protein [Sediminibacterium sp.]MDP3129084.1 hypothetical protein [Sediminibacterium sp.]